MAWYCTVPMMLAQAAAPAVAGDESGLSMSLKLILAAGTIVGSFLLGALVARGLRMPDHATRIGLVFFTLIASMVVIVTGWPPKRGIDLSGGVVLVYEVDTSLAQPSWLQNAVSRVSDQLNASGGEKLTVRPVGTNQIEIVVPDEADLPRVDKVVATLRGTDLVLQNDGKRAEDGKTILAYRIDAREQQTIDMQKLIAAVGKRINPDGLKELTIRQYGAEQIEVIIPEVEEREVDHIKRLISTSGVLEFRIVANENDDKDIIRAAEKTPGRDVYIGGRLVGRWVQAGPELFVPGATMRQVEGQGRQILIRIDPFNVDGRYLRHASQDYAEGRPAVKFSFDAVGGDKFGQLTSHNLPDEAIGFFRHLGIVLDNVMLSAPRINSTIHGEGQITGNFTQEEVDTLIGILNAGSLPATLRPEPISQQRISAQLGDDTIKSGTMAMAVSTGAILIFMAIYYRFAGLVADVAVVLNMIVTVALMILIKAAFTLPGLAGMVLTVGMAVDANVLIYERMREETARGASLRMAIRNGFSRAMATIIDSHVTTLITAIVLFIIGTDQIKGFAITLILGLAMSMYTAVFVARVIFDVFEKQRWLTKLNMMHVIGVTNLDFIRWRTPAILASVVLIVAGLIAAAMRGKELLDIDFTGGSSVQLLFAADKPQDIADVRSAVEKLSEELPDAAVSSVGDKNLEFKVDTSNHDISVVKAALTKAFQGSLETYAMTHGAVDLVAAPADKSPEADKPAAAPESTKPAAESAPAATPPAAEAPAATPPAAEEKPAPAETPATPPAAEGQPNTPAATEEKAPGSAMKDQGRQEIQVADVGTQVAIAALLSAQDTPAESKPAAESATPPAASEAVTAQGNVEVNSSAPAASETKPEAQAEPEAEAKPASQPPAQAADATATLSIPSGPAGAATFAGGSRVTLEFPQSISYPALRSLIEAQFEKSSFKGAVFELRNPKYSPGSDARFNSWTMETTLKPEETDVFLKQVQTYLTDSPVFPSSSEIGGKVAGDTQLMALYAILASMVMIVIYVWIRFQNVIFGLAAVLALVHDVLITIGFLALSFYLAPYLGILLVDPFKISLAVVAALLTIVGFSINDTIVVFDRIREVRGKSPDLTTEMINLSINQTLSRTLLTSGTVLIASVILYIMGGPGIHAFAFSMVVGCIAGTYSSVYMAAPVLLLMHKPAPKQGRVTTKA